jgi:hypothetical protein
LTTTRKTKTTSTASSLRDELRRDEVNRGMKLRMDEVEEG